MKSHYMSTTAGRREELDLQLHLVREKRRIEMQILDEVSLENRSMSKDEIQKIVQEKMSERFPSSIEVQGRVIHVNDEVKVKDDFSLFAAVESQLPIQDTLKRVYLGERGTLVQVVPSFHGRRAAVIRFADGAQKAFFVECLDFAGVRQKGSTSALSATQESGENQGVIKASVGGVNKTDSGLNHSPDRENRGKHNTDEDEKADETSNLATATWDDLSNLHSLTRNRSYYSQASPTRSSSCSSSDESGYHDDRHKPMPLPKPMPSKDSLPGTQGQSRAHASPIPLAPSPPVSLEELRRTFAQAEQKTEKSVRDKKSSELRECSVMRTASSDRMNTSQRTEENDSNDMAEQRTRAGSAVKCGDEPLERSATQENNRADDQPSPIIMMGRLRANATTLLATPLRPTGTNSGKGDEDPLLASPSPQAPLIDEVHAVERPAGLPISLRLTSRVPPTEMTGAREGAAEDTSLTRSLHVVESSAPLPEDVLQTLARHNGTLGGLPTGSGSNIASQHSAPITATKSPGPSKARTGKLAPHCAMGLVKRRVQPASAGAIFEDLGDPYTAEELEPLGQPVKLFNSGNFPSDGSESETEPLQDNASKLTGIPQRAPPGYKAKFSFYDANTSIPRYIPVQPSSMRRILVAGYLRTGAGSTTASPLQSSRSTTIQGSVPRLRFVEVFYRRDAPMDVILSTVTTALGWEDEERAERLFTLTGNEVLWEENIEEGMQLIATPGNLYHPLRQPSEATSIGRERLESMTPKVFEKNPYHIAASEDKKMDDGMEDRRRNSPPSETRTSTSSIPVNRTQSDTVMNAELVSPPPPNPSISGRVTEPLNSSSTTVRPAPIKNLTKRPTSQNVTKLSHRDPVSNPSPPIVKKELTSPVPTPVTAEPGFRKTPPSAAQNSRSALPATPTESVGVVGRKSDPNNAPITNVSGTLGNATAAVKNSRRTVVKAPPVAASKPIHIKVFENGQYDDDERVFRLVTVRSNYKTIGALKTLIGRELEWRDGKKVDLLFDATGVPITTLEQIQDGDALVASSGDRFIVPYPNSVLHREAAQKLAGGIS